MTTVPATPPRAGLASEPLARRLAAATAFPALVAGLLLAFALYLAPVVAIALILL